MLQPKLTFGMAGDSAEREADRVADQVMRGDAEPITAVPAGVDRLLDDAGSANRAEPMPPSGSANVPVPSSQVDDTVRSSGHPLSDAVRRFFEPRFRRPFGQVRIHTDAAASRSAAAIGARAYTVGRHIVFAHGAYRPSSAVGRALIAHELTHVVQQSNGRLADTVSRSPDEWAKPMPGSFDMVTMPRDTGGVSPIGQRGPFFVGATPTREDADPLFFDARGKAPVTEARLVNWAAERMQQSMEPFRLVSLSLLQRRQDDRLRAMWVKQLDGRLKEIMSSHGFTGSDSARRRTQELLRPHADALVAQGMQWSEDRLIEAVLGALHSGHIPSGAELETDAARITRIEDAPEHEPTPLGVDLGNRQRTIKAGDEWLGRRIVSSNTYGLVVEIADHPGVYFSISATQLVRSNAFAGIVAGGIASRTRALDVFGKFIKGFLTALASLPVAVADAAAKLVDMQTMFFAALGRATGWYEIGYSCLSSTCKTYDECTQENSAAVCKEEVLTQALKDATVVVPIAEQIKHCYHGDAEACGGVAALFVPLIGKGLTGLTPALEEAGVRSILGRARPGEAHLFEEQPSKKAAHEEVGGGHGEAALQAGGAERAGRLKSFASRVSARLRGGATIAPEAIEREIRQVERNAGDASKVRHPKDATFDAEVPTEDGRVTYRREAGSSTWDRCWNPCEREAPVEKATSAAADAALEKADAAAATEAVKTARRGGAKVSDTVPARELRQEFRNRLQAKVTEAKAAVDALKRSKDKVASRLEDIHDRLKATSDPATRATLRSQREALIKFRDEQLGSGEDLAANWLEAKRLLRGTEQDYFRSLSDAARADPRYKAVAGRGVDGVFGTKGRALEVEHVEPRSAIFRKPGFERLSWNDQVSLFNYEPNLKLIPADINNARSNIPYGEWSRGEWSKFPEISGNTIADLATLQQTMSAAFDRMIANPQTIPRRR